jgi:translation initiation factor IF-2
MTKKVYDLAKEYGMQSKDFVLLLQQANIPVKNHMSALSDQQEKYFRNNFDVINNQIMAKAQAAVSAETKPAKEQPVKKAAPQARPQSGSGQTQDGSRPYRPQTRDASSRPSSGQQQPYGRSNREGSGQRSGGYQHRASNQNRDPNRTYSKPRGSYQDRQGQGADGRGPQRDYRGPNPNRPSGQRPQGASGQNRDGSRSGHYTKPQGSYQGRQGGYQGKPGGDGRPPREGGYPNKDRPQQSGQWNKDARSQNLRTKIFQQKNHPRHL